jgi:threonine synthase
LEEKYFVCTGCQKRYPPDRIFPRCDDCFEPLEVEIFQEKINKKNHPKTTVDIHDNNILSKYASYYSFTHLDKELSLKEGNTPLIQANSLPSLLDIDNIYLKNETVNPTWSFKDRGTLSSIQHAKNSGYNYIGTVSSGNMAVSVAAYGARANIKTFVLVSADIPEEKIKPVLIYNPVLIKVEGNYGKLYFESLKIGRETGIYFLNSDVPFRVEGSKSIAFELCEQFNYDVPDYVIIPTSSGGNARGIIKGFLEFYQSGIIDNLPRFVCVQLEGCAPIYQAWINRIDRISPVVKPKAIDNAIANPYPPSGNELLRKLRKYDGIVTAVSDKEALAAQKMLAREGIFAQPAAAVSLPAIQKLRIKGIISKTDKCVAIITGSGLKYPGILDYHRFDIRTCTLENMKENIVSILKK